MSNRIPLILNPAAGQIQELAAIDNLDLGNSSIVGVNSLSANTIIANSVAVSGNLTVSQTITASNNLNLSNSNIVGVNSLSAASAVISGNLTVMGTITGTGIGSGSGGGTSSSGTSNMLMSIIFGR